ncbi:hypothetical protein J2S90_002343 [Arthrobacter bambusae]|uniref:Uncharacterized protein n=1 Tax=Arthrobacter bambusae TaxID=1338426 RepID=A0AAW8DAN1_9MICC|nr:hypothetical protein [Arthrobacter bambusae]MDQ0129145.1 hypothetical protein [Arthrobacter bambusae]MDQ0180509.1 hypothetical protein [Arthrobacter bambusae]
MFISGVESATWINEVQVRFEAVVGAVSREYDAWIVAREPDEQIAWQSVRHPSREERYFSSRWGQRKQRYSCV